MSGHPKLLHCRSHGLKVQHLVFPDGIVLVFFAPLRDGDSALLAASQLDIQLRALFLPTGEEVFAFGDPAYSETGRILRTNKGVTSGSLGATNAELLASDVVFNGCAATDTPNPSRPRKVDASMRGPREAVEWTFAKVVQLFPLLNHWRQLKLWGSPICDWWLFCALFSNIHTCCYGSQVSCYFEMQPPTVQDYLQNSNRNRMP